MTVRAEGLPEAAIRDRARSGAAAVFPALAGYGEQVYGQSPGWSTADELDRTRLVPPVFVPRRLEKLIELGREPLYSDVDTRTSVGGFTATLPLYLSAFGSTQLGSTGLGVAAARQAGELGIPMVIGENVVPVNGYGRGAADAGAMLMARVRAYLERVPDDVGGVVVQQSTEDADAEVWNLVYSDPAVAPLLAEGRLAFELKVGQGAKPGLGGMTVLGAQAARRVGDQFAIDAIFADDRVLRSSSPGTFTDEILRQQIRLMRNNFPRARVWVKLPGARDVAAAAAVAWAAGADAVTVDGAEGGSGWAPTAFLDTVGLPLAECLRRIGSPGGCLLASGRMWEGTRAVKCLALGARAVGLGRAALVAVDEDPDHGLVRLVAALALEMRLLASALGKYTTGALDAADLWLPGTPATADVLPALVPGTTPGNG
ncbi:glutamate synthase-related protein [Actinokineospora terrae]|uniref:Glutamate synthase conserved region-containing protein n=1 Tax=Actinokineospora terrae TaxID=155974 RepID=A0A1H9MKM2_9PSEU|nr:glutamate synthase-related protein [Actinokineospora terrae]SER24007.1 glutamate synthase conserved region-containing protein [Actinokineospora terrae]